MHAVQNESSGFITQSPLLDISLLLDRKPAVVLSKNLKILLICQKKLDKSQGVVFAIYALLLTKLKIFKNLCYKILKQLKLIFCQIEISKTGTHFLFQVVI